ncbi:MAG: DNA helicase [Chloroflexi bacterium GWB2_49_20]|nr:MAG: DNA helicase [Chloroflexi bacterium GWB2_49_20]OGN78009.1 MAG: DNA helicase [Chloroflexi bacterium GWC2_49_37]OGN85047.1 MAG: DNA helicase [Chloroflexi bacterium GWD2_49_16]HBG74917.1 DNA helicase [Anaerolineae bacterium]HCC78359.1 DNA helicase [Anaerolineae bacterium]
MEFRIADTFVDSLSRLNNQDQKEVKTTVFDLQVNPSTHGMSFHKLDRARDPNFASVRVSSDLRLIVHQAPGSLLICYVNHHDNAYRWAERRKLEIHPTTGAAQLVEIRETVQEIIIPNYITEERLKAPLFASRSDEELLGFGVPPEWLGDVRAATEDNYLELADHLPAEAAEALLELAVGGNPQTLPVPTTVTDPFDHPDALRRFRVMGDMDELLRALEYPWEKWTVFLHPEQRRFATGNYNGPARVSGSAGTGKTVVALHRAVHLAKTNPEARILLTTFSDTLANSLKTKLRMLIQNMPHLGDQIEVYSMNAMAERLYGLNLGKVQLASPKTIRSMVADSAAKVSGHSFNQHFLESEWEQVVDAWQLDCWEAYRDVARLGRKTRLTENHRKICWSIFEKVQSALREQRLITQAGMFNQLTALYAAGQRAPFDFLVVDEAQDVNVSQLKLLAALAGNRPNSLFFAGDLGQRIFQQPFSWKSLGVDVRGRSKTLHINYRTSHQIRKQADKLLGPELADMDGITETRSGTISVFNGPAPIIETFDSEGSEIEAVAVWLKERLDNGLQPEEIGVFVRSEAQIPRAKAALDAAGLAYKVLDQKVETTVGSASLCSMHLAKGLEFRAVAVIACDDEIIPLQERIETATDTSDLEEVYNTERHLLYVACTRARDNLLITSVEPASEFLDDMRM